MNFSTHLKITPSATIAINTLALQKKQKGERVYNLCAGEPMIDTPEIIKQAALKALQENKTHYPPVAGILELRQEAVMWFNKNYNGDYRQANVLVSTGGKMGLYLLLQTLIAPGDEVLIISPYWVSYPAMAELFGGVPRIIETGEENNWRVDLVDLKKNYSAKSKVLIFNNGSNPTGILYSQEEIKKILAFAAEKNIFVISDEVYSGLTYDNQQFVSCAGFPEFKDNLAIIQSCSKNLAMTGWRVGFVFAPEEIIKILTDLTSQSTTGVATISQYAALAGLQNVEVLTAEIRNEMQKRRDVFVNELNKLFHPPIGEAGCAIVKLSAGLYAFVALKDLGVAETDSVAFCQRVLAETNVAIVPGAAFGKEGYVRFSFGERVEELKAGLEQLARYLKM